MSVALGLAMLGFQFSIGAVNDLIDEPLDARMKPAKPIPAGLITRQAARAIAVMSGAAGIVLSAAYGPVILVLGVAMYACGLVYDRFLKPTRFAGLCFAVAFPLLPVYAWWAATGELPPRASVLLPIAALAGPMLQLANGLVDLEGDRAQGLAGPVVRLGRRRALVLLAGLQAVIHGLAWITLVGGADVPATSLVAVVAASLLAAVGVWLSAAAEPAMRERGWQAQASAIVLLGAGWVLAATPS